MIGSVFKTLLQTICAVSALLSTSARASAVRPFLEQLPPPSKQRQIEFEILIDRIISFFQSSAQAHGAKFSREIFWNSSGIGAFTQRLDYGTNWRISFYDGILRLPFVNDDVITLVACHEIGHHIGGYPFKENGWSSAEGQADYFATHACLPKVWKDQRERNESFVSMVKTDFRKKCDESFAEVWRRQICYRSTVAMEHMVHYEGYGKKTQPKLSLKDKTKVISTQLMHPSPQCRIDTQLAGIFCGMLFDFENIPGHFNRGENTLSAEQESNRFICTTKSMQPDAARPRCWFAPLGVEFE